MSDTEWDALCKFYDVVSKDFLFHSFKDGNEFKQFTTESIMDLLSVTDEDSKDGTGSSSRTYVLLKLTIIEHLLRIWSGENGSKGKDIKSTEPVCSTRLCSDIFAESASLQDDTKLQSCLLELMCKTMPSSDPFISFKACNVFCCFTRIRIISLLLNKYSTENLNQSLQQLAKNHSAMFYDVCMCLFKHFRKNMTSFLNCKSRKNSGDDVPPPTNFLRCAVQLILHLLSEDMEQNWGTKETKTAVPETPEQLNLCWLTKQSNKCPLFMIITKLKLSHQVVKLNNLFIQTGSLLKSPECKVTSSRSDKPSTLWCTAPFVQVHKTIAYFDNINPEINDIFSGSNMIFNKVKSLTQFFVKAYSEMLKSKPESRDISEHILKCISTYTDAYMLLQNIPVHLDYGLATNEVISEFLELWLSDTLQTDFLVKHLTLKGFGGKLHRQSSANEDVTFEMKNTKFIRVMTLVVIKSCWICFCSEQDCVVKLLGKQIPLSGALVKILQLFKDSSEEFISGRGADLTSHANRSFQECCVQIMVDQDSDLFKALLYLLCIYQKLDKLSRGGKITEDGQLVYDNLNPHKLFFCLLKETQFDHSLLIDWIISPETCFCQYFYLYLNLIVDDFQLFRIALESADATPTFSSCMKSDCPNEKRFTPLSNKSSQPLFQNRSKFSMTFDSSSIGLFTPSHERSTPVTSQAKRKFRQGGPENVTHARPLVDYELSESSSSDEEASHDAELACTISDGQQGLSCSSSKASESKTLDDVLSVLIRLKLKLERLESKGLVTFSAEPLLGLLERTEELYDIYCS